MRWERLFDDLEAQADAAEREELCGEIADRTRRELAQVNVEDRLRAGTRTPVVLRLSGGHHVSGVIREAGAGWMWLVTTTGDVLVVTAAICEIGGLGTAVATPLGEVEARIDLRHVLRVLAQDRRRCALGVTDGRELRGVVVRVGRDFVDLVDRSEVELGRPASRTVPLSALALVR